MSFLGKCSNCYASSTSEILNSIDTSKTSAVTSDAQLMKCFTAVRTLCNKCGSIEIHYEPQDTLKKYFSEEYDISDSVQNNLIIKNSIAIGKHAYIIDILFPQLKSLRECGIFLEIACGKGELTISFQERYPLWKCFGIDPSLKSSLLYKKREVNFIQDYFKEEYFDGIKFDLIVAHGFLNRSPVLPELIKIRNCLKKGSFLSLEILTLENSTFTPYIWDHPFMYKMNVFEEYLKHAGFSIISKTNCISSYHYLCRSDSDPKASEAIIVEKEEVEDSRKLFSSHVSWWEKVKKNYLTIISKGLNKQYGLFGAGLYSAVLCNLVCINELKLVVDEVRNNNTFFGLPVVKIDDASRIKDCLILICTRLNYLEHINKKLHNAGVESLILNPET